jgi:hypothetical protein
MLKTKHLFPFLKLIRAMGIKDLLGRLAQMWSQPKDAEAKDALAGQLGLDIVAMLLERAPDAEAELYAFLTAYTGKARAELEELSVEELIALLKQVLAEANFSAFFKQAVDSQK